MATAIRAIRKGFITKRTRVRPQTAVQYQMVLQSFRPLEFAIANRAFVLLLIGMDDHMHLEGAFCVENEATVRADVHGPGVYVLVCLREKQKFVLDANRLKVVWHSLSVLQVF